MLSEEINHVAAEVSAILRGSLTANCSLLYRAAYHLPSQGGKRMRPFLVAKSSELVGGSAKSVMPAAAAVELLHNFTLVHDDIMDNDALRRGVPTVHTVWGMPMAILAGDLMFAKAFQILLRAGGDDRRVRAAADELATATIDLSEGQHLDMSFEERRDVREDEYLAMISGKTAALFRASAKIGAILGGGSDEAVARLGEYGWNMGMAFQIYDDYLGLTSKEEVLGKAIGNDIREGKKTLIVIKGMSSDAAPLLSDALGKKSVPNEKMAALLRQLQENGTFDYVYAKAKSYVVAALGSLSLFPESAARTSLFQLAEMAISRKK
jgi:geranylgeranyl diphosphate synthase type I